MQVLYAVFVKAQSIETVSTNIVHSIVSTNAFQSLYDYVFRSDIHPKLKTFYKITINDMTALKTTAALVQFGVSSSN